MRKLFQAVTVALAFAVPAQADDWSIIGSAHWLEREGEDRLQEGGSASMVDFHFDAGAGVGVGFLFDFADAFAVELKGSFARIDGTVRTELSDAVFLLDLGDVDVVPLTAVLQWRPLQDSKWDPYVGMGGGYLFVGDSDVPDTDERIEFDGDVGLVIEAGVDFQFAERWFLNLDAKYIPVETGIETRFGERKGTLDFEPVLGSVGVRHRF